MSYFDPVPKFEPELDPEQEPAVVVPSYIGKAELVGNWLFYNGAGTKLYDYSGRGNHGDFEINPEWIDGRYGWCVDFDSADGDRINIPDDPSLDLTDAITILAWVNADEFVNYEAIANKEENGSYCWRLWVEAGPQVRGTIQDTASNFYGVAASAPLSTGEWEQVGFTYEVTSPASDITVYHNGTSVGAAAGSTNDIITSNDPLWIGSLSTSVYLNGRLAWVLIYGRKLSGAEVERFFEETRVLFGV